MNSSAIASSATSNKRSLHIGLWVVQGLLAAAFLASGVMKLTTPAEQLAEAMPWAADTMWLVRFIGLSEFAGAVGLIVPAATRIKPQLTALAALGLLTVMILAAGFHVVRGEFAHLPPSLVLGALAAFVAWGRSKRAVIDPR